MSVRTFPLVSLITALALASCATPPAIKQALATEDDAYRQNIALAQKYQQLVSDHNARVETWYMYVMTRTKLNLALLWITTNPLSGNPEVSAEQYADVSARLLGDNLVQEVNRLRLQGLPSRAGASGTMLFAAGSAENLDAVIKSTPHLVTLARTASQKEYDAIMQGSGNSDAYSQYATNVAILRELNHTVQTYLDIDVTVKSDDVKAIADSIRQLSK